MMDSEKLEKGLKQLVANVYRAAREQRNERPTSYTTSKHQHQQHQLQQHGNNDSNGMGNDAVLQSALADLETTDENFHRYDFVRELRHRIDELIGPLIESSEAMKEGDRKRLLSDNGDSAIAPSVVHEILRSSSVQTLIQQVLSSASTVSERVANDAHNGLTSGRRSRLHKSGSLGGHGIRIGGRSSVASSVLASTTVEGSEADGDDLSMSPSRHRFPYHDLNESFGDLGTIGDPDLSFLPPFERIPSICDGLAPSQPLELRLSSMKSLHRFTPGDFLASAYWDRVLNTLRVALSDPESAIADQALQMHALLFKAAPHQATGDVYVNFVLHISASLAEVSTCNNDHDSGNMDASSGLDANDPTTMRLLREFRLLSVFQHQLPFYWLRYPEELFGKCVALTLSLLRCPPEKRGSRNSPVTALHFLAVVDPHATWFHKWVRGHHGRAHIVRLFRAGVVRKDGDNDTTVTVTPQEYIDDDSSDNRGCSLADIVWHALDFEVLHNVLNSKKDVQVSVGKSMKIEDILDDVDATSSKYGSSQHRFFYNEAQLKYLCFLHTVSIVLQMLGYRSIRDLFPVQFKCHPSLLSAVVSSDTSSTVGIKHGVSINNSSTVKSNCSDDVVIVNVTSVLVALVRAVHLAQACGESAGPRINGSEAFAFGEFVLSLLRDLAASGQACSILCRDTVIWELALPLRQFLRSREVNADIIGKFHGTTRNGAEKKLSIKTTPIKFSTAHITASAGILALLAATNRGRLVLLYGERAFKSIDHCVSEESCSNDDDEWKHLDYETKGLKHGTQPVPESHNDLWGDGSAADAMADFVRCALDQSLKDEPPLAVVAAYTFCVRQLYNTAEGLHALGRHQLHNCLADALLALPPDSEINGLHDSKAMDENCIYIRDAWVDNLLNFAGTPKGVSLLQRTGVLDQCVDLMFRRYKKKLQVSDVEKFGYGVLVAQVTATGPGMVAVMRSGLMESYVDDLWLLLESGQLFSAPHLVDAVDHPSKKVVANIIKLVSSFPAVYEIVAATAPAPTSAVVNVNDGIMPIPRESASSSSSIPTVVTVTTAASIADKLDTDNTDEEWGHTEVNSAPKTICELIERLVLVNKPSKLAALTNFVQSHLAGLRVLSILTSCLDSCLLLQARYGIAEELIALQRDNRLDRNEKRPHMESSTTTNTSKSNGGSNNKSVVSKNSHNFVFIIDECSVARNRLLVATYLLGGPSERLLPPFSVDDTTISNLSELFCEYPAPSCYVSTLASRGILGPSGETIPGLEKLYSLSTSTNDDDGDYITILQREFSRAMLSELTIPQSLLACIISRTVEHQYSIPREYFFPEVSSVTKSDIATGNGNAVTPAVMAEFRDAMTANGVDLIVRYGVQLHLIESSKASKLAARADLNNILPAVENMLLHMIIGAGENRQKIVASDSQSVPTYVGFDWFSAVMYLLFGSSEDTMNFLGNLAKMIMSAYLWPSRLPAAGVLPADGIHPSYAITSHNVEHILQIELPLVFSAFRLSGYTPSQICQHWIRQCFLNFLDFSEISIYITTCIVMGMDFQVYFCIAIFKHLQPTILRHTQQQRLVVLLKEEPIVGFYTKNFFSYMNELAAKYQHRVLPDMLHSCY